MTCIVGVVDGNRVIMGGDRCFFDRSWSSKQVGHYPKIRRCIYKGGRYGDMDAVMIVGASGSSRLAQLVHRAEPPRWNQLTASFEEWGVAYVDALLAAFKEAGYEYRFPGRAGGEDDLNVLVALPGGFLGEIGSDLGFSAPADGFTAIGSGFAPALGALYATRRWKNPYARAEEALKAAERLTLGVGGPFDVDEV